MLLLNGEIADAVFPGYDKPMIWFETYEGACEFLFRFVLLMEVYGYAPIMDIYHVDGPFDNAIHHMYSSNEDYNQMRADEASSIFILLKETLNGPYKRLSDKLQITHNPLDYRLSVVMTFSRKWTPLQKIKIICPHGDKGHVEVQVETDKFPSRKISRV